MSDEIKGVAKDGKEFNAESQEVKEYLEKYPDVTLEAAIGSVIMEYEKTLPADGEATPESGEESGDEAEEEDSADEPANEEA